MSLNKKYKNTPFKIPKRYFKNFDAAFLHELELEKEIKEILKRLGACIYLNSHHVTTHF